MNYNHQIIDELIKAVTPIPCEFGVIVDDISQNEPVNFYNISNRVLGIDPEAEICFGMSKLVIIPSDSNVVIKIPFNGMYDEDEDYELIWCDFYGAAGSIPDDYCQSEYEKYLALKEQHLECFVAETEFYTKVDHTNIFIAENVTSFNDLYQETAPSPSKKSNDTAEQLRKNKRLYYLDTTWLANCIDFYGEEKVEQFLQYCKNVDPDITADIHGGNFGYRKSDNSPCILDYSNFDD